MERWRFVITLCFRQLVSIFTQTERKTFFGKSSRNQIRKKTSNSIFLLLKPKTPRVKRYQRGQQLLRLFFVFFDKNETCCINFFSRILFFRLGGVVFSATKKIPSIGAICFGDTVREYLLDSMRKREKDCENASKRVNDSECEKGFKRGWMRERVWEWKEKG